MKADEPSLIAKILELAGEFARFGYRRITRLLDNDSWRVNAKRIYPLWRQERLKVPQKKQKRRRLGPSMRVIVRSNAEYKNHV